MVVIAQFITKYVCRVCSICLQKFAEFSTMRGSGSNQCVLTVLSVATAYSYHEVEAVCYNSHDYDDQFRVCNVVRDNIP